MPTKEPRLAFVCPTPIRERIRELAARERRSISAQIVISIEEHLAKNTPDLVFACGGITCLGSTYQLLRAN